MKRNIYQTGGLPEKEKKGQESYDERDQRIKDNLIGGLDKVGEGFTDALDKNIEGLTRDEEKIMDAWDKGNKLEALVLGALYLPKAWMGIVPQGTGFLATEAGKWIINNVGPSMSKEDRDAFNNKFRPHSHAAPKQAGGLRRYQKGGEKATVGSTGSLTRKKRQELQQKLQKKQTGGFLEDPVERLFED